jgi:predicted ATPase
VTAWRPAGSATSAPCGLWCRTGEPPVIQWPTTIPAVAQILDSGLELPPGVTILVGENGSGKSTVVEAVAMAFGLSAEGGSTFARHGTRATESDLWRWITLQRSAPSRPVLR